MEKIQEILFKYKDQKYKEFSAKLSPTINPDSFIGIRVPILRQIAKELDKDVADEFIKELPHKYVEENLLHGFIIQKEKDYITALEKINKFLPYVDNWAVTDTMGPKVFSKHKNELINEIQKWVKSNHTYTIRFGVDMLMAHYLDKEFKKEYLEIPNKIKSDDYYVKMMIAWYYATALAKQWDDAIKIIESKILPVWIQNKTIQKAIESFRVSDEHKEYLKTLKIKN